MKCVLAVVVGVLAIASAVRSGNFEQPQGYTFEEYLADFDKSYPDPEEYALHEQLFKAAVEEVVSHNADESQSWKKGINQFSDMTQAEKQRYLGTNPRKNTMGMPLRSHNTAVDVSALPDSVDWRTKQPSVVSPVKNQGGCGSCWAFAATETIESGVAINTGKLPILSTQNMVSCTPNPQHCGGTGGCDGATAELGMEYVKNKQISAEADYPYTARTGTCKEIKKTASITGWVKLIENNYTDLLIAIATIGPQAVSVAAGPWMSYSSGVFTGCRFAPTNVIIDHGVQLVGYGTDPTSKRDYWIVRNSWGGGWGERGYIRLEKHSDGDPKKWCAPDNRPQDGTGCDGGPAVVTVCGSCGIWYDTCYSTGGKLV